MARDNVDYICLNQGEPIYLKVNDEYVFSHDWTNLGGTSGNLTNAAHTLYRDDDDYSSTALSGSTTTTNAPGS